MSQYNYEAHNYKKPHAKIWRFNYNEFKQFLD